VKSTKVYLVQWILIFVVDGALEWHKVKSELTLSFVCDWQNILTNSKHDQESLCGQSHWMGSSVQMIRCFKEGQQSLEDDPWKEGQQLLIRRRPLYRFKCSPKKTISEQLIKSPSMYRDIFFTIYNKLSVINALPHLWESGTGCSTMTMHWLIVCFSTEVSDQKWYHCASTTFLLSRSSPCQ
jgi:hypothetical protein